MLDRQRCASPGERQGNDMKSGAWLRAVVIGSAAGVMLLGAAGLRADDAGSGGSARAVRLSNVDGQVQVAQGADASDEGGQRGVRRQGPGTRDQGSEKQGLGIRGLWGTVGSRSGFSPSLPSGSE